MSIDTTHFKLASRRHGWNWSQNASDRKGLLSFGCSLEQLELLGMLESHIERLERLEKAARDLAALSNDQSLEALASPNWPIKPPAVTSGVAQQGLRGYWTSPHPSPGIPGTPASCWGRRESHLGTILVCAPLSKQLPLCGALFLRIENLRYLTSSGKFINKKTNLLFLKKITINNKEK